MKVESPMEKFPSPERFPLLVRKRLEELMKSGSPNSTCTASAQGTDKHDGACEDDQETLKGIQGIHSSAGSVASSLHSWMEQFKDKEISFVFDNVQCPSTELLERVQSSALAKKEGTPSSSVLGDAASCSSFSGDTPDGFIIPMKPSSTVFRMSAAMIPWSSDSDEEEEEPREDSSWSNMISQVVKSPTRHTRWDATPSDRKSSSLRCRDIWNREHLLSPQKEFSNNESCRDLVSKAKSSIEMSKTLLAKRSSPSSSPSSQRRINKIAASVA